MSKQEIEELSTEELLSLEASKVGSLEPVAKAIYDRRMVINNITTSQMENMRGRYVQNFKPHDSKDLKPEVKEIFDRRMSAPLITT